MNPGPANASLALRGAGCRLRLAQAGLAAEIAAFCAAPLLAFYAVGLARLALLAAACAPMLGVPLPEGLSWAVELAFGRRPAYWGDFAAGLAEALALAGFGAFMASPFLGHLRRPCLDLRPGFLGAPGQENFYGALAFGALFAGSALARLAADAARSHFIGAGAAPGAFYASGAHLAFAGALFCCAALAARGSRSFSKLWLFAPGLAPEQKLLALRMHKPGSPALSASFGSDDPAALCAACFKRELEQSLRLCLPFCAEPMILQAGALYPYIARENPAFANKILLECKSSLTEAEASLALGFSLENALLRPQSDPGMAPFLSFFDSFGPGERQSAFCGLLLKKAAAGSLGFNAFFNDPNGPEALRKSLFDSLAQIPPGRLSEFEAELRKRAAKACSYPAFAAFSADQAGAGDSLQHFRCGPESLENILLRAREKALLQACLERSCPGVQAFRGAL